MNELVKNENGQPVTNSLLVAQKFGKRHTHVVDSIKKMLSTAENSALLSMFCESTYLSEQNKELPMYIMNRDGFSLLVMGFTGKDALKFKIDFINAFNEMEERLKSPAKVLTTSEMFLQQAQINVEQEKRIADVERQVKVLEAKTATRPDYFTIVGYGTLHGMSINLREASRIGGIASRICKARGIEMDSTPDPRFGKVRMYPISVLEEVFNQPIN